MDSTKSYNNKIEEVVIPPLPNELKSLEKLINSLDKKDIQVGDVCTFYKKYGEKTCYIIGRILYNTLTNKLYFTDQTDVCNDYGSLKNRFNRKASMNNAINYSMVKNFHKLNELEEDYFIIDKL